MKTFLALILGLIMLSSVAWAGMVTFNCVGCTSLHNMGTVQLAMKYPSGPYKEQVLDLVKNGSCRTVEAGTKAHLYENLIYESKVGNVWHIRFYEGTSKVIIYIPEDCFLR